jgi:hypothetical protein
MRFVVTAAVCVLAGCGTKAYVGSNKTSEYTEQPKRIAMIETFGQGLSAEQVSDFDLSFARSINTCQVDIAILTLPQQDSADAPSLTAAFVAAHKAEALLTIGTTMTGTLGGQLAVIQYLLSLTDVASGKLVWKAVVTLYDVEDNKSHLGQDLSAAVMKRMQKDQLVANCAGSA